MKKSSLHRQAKPGLILWWMVFAFSLQAHSQNLFAGFEHLFTAPKNYVALFVAGKPIIDGDLNDASWQTAPWTDLFEDIEGSKRPLPKLKTRAKMVWSDSCLYIAAELEEPHVWASLKHHDAIIYHDNDFEVFIDPTNDAHQYFEIEVNAFNTILDLFMPKPYRNGGAAMLSYNTGGLQSAVRVNGTINNPADRDESWTVEMAIPFRSIYIGNSWRAPRDGDLWRVNFSRVQWDTERNNGKYVKAKDDKGRALPEYNWVWSPQGVINMHFPERWGYLQFTRNPKGNAVFVLPQDEKRRQYLWLLYYKQRAYFGKHQKYATTLQSLGLPEEILVENARHVLQLEATSRQFSGYISSQEATLSINEEGFVQRLKKAL